MKRLSENKTIQIKNYCFIGNYDRLGNKITNPDTTFLISRRTKPTIKKPEFFLLRINSDHTRDYISSLFETEETTVYDLEYQQSHYQLILSELTAQIVSAK